MVRAGLKFRGTSHKIHLLHLLEKMLVVYCGSHVKLFARVWFVVAKISSVVKKFEGSTIYRQRELGTKDGLTQQIQ